MRTIIFGGMMFIYWSAFYTLTSVIKEEKLVVATFVVTLVISMVTAAIFLVRTK